MPQSEEFLTHRRHGTCGTGSSGSGGTGDVTFQTPADYSSVTEIEARVRLEGSSTVVATKRIGRPPGPNSGFATFSLAAILNSLSPGNYRVSVAMINASGTTDSPESDIAYVVPLQTP